MLVFCQASYWERRDQTLECIKRVAPYVDRVVIVEPDYDIDWCTQISMQYPNVQFHRREWKDNFPEYRNEYLKLCNYGDWVCVADPDEFYGEQLCKDLRKITGDADKEEITLLLINSHDIDIKLDGTRDERISTFFKNLIFKYAEGVHYEGVGEAKNVHETLLIPYGKPKSLDKKYFYEHVKTQLEIWERAFRNVWIGGGGNNVGVINPAWEPLHKITDIMLGLKSWPQVREYLRKGNIDSVLKEWIIAHRNDCGWDWENETSECFLYYFTMHPKEMPEGIERKPEKPSLGSPPEVMAYVERCFLEVLGRHADDPGKKAYTNAIIKGEIMREALPLILRRSDEYKRRFPERVKEVEKVRIPVPVDVDVKVTQEHFVKALKKSKLYSTQIKPKLEFANKWYKLLSLAMKVETGGKGVDESPRESFIPFVETFAQYCPPEKHTYVLDIGAGCGAETSVLIEKGYKVVGITFGEENVKYAKEKFGIDLLEMDMHNLQFPKKYFDAVFMIQTFEHSLSPWLFILELRKVLKDGGRVFLDVPDPDDEEMLKTIWHTSVFYPNQIKALFHKAGFKEVVDVSQKHRLAFLFEKIPGGQFEMWGYVKYLV